MAKRQKTLEQYTVDTIFNSLNLNNIFKYSESIRTANFVVRHELILVSQAVEKRRFYLMGQAPFSFIIPACQKRQVADRLPATES